MVGKSLCEYSVICLLSCPVFCFVVLYAYVLCLALYVSVKCKRNVVLALLYAFVKCVPKRVL